MSEAENRVQNNLLELIPEPFRDDVHEYLLTNWAMLSAFSYRSFLRRGKGLIAIEYGKSEIAYLPWSFLQAEWDDLMQHTDESLQQNIRSFLETYNPEEEIVVFFEFPMEENNGRILKISASAIAVISEAGSIGVLAEMPTPKAYYELEKESVRSLGKKFTK